MIKNGYTEAVGGVVLMTSGGNAKEIVSRVKKRVAEINQQTHDPRRSADRSLLRPLTTGRCRHPYRDGGAGRGHVFVVVILFLFLGDLRSSLIVSANLVLTPLLTFLVMNHDRPLGQPDVAGRARDRHRSDGRWFRGRGGKYLRAA